MNGEGYSSAVALVIVSTIDFYSFKKCSKKVQQKNVQKNIQQKKVQQNVQQFLQHHSSKVKERCCLNGKVFVRKN